MPRGSSRKPSRHVGTIGELVRQDHTLTLNCEGCRHRSEIDLHALILAHGENYLVRKVVDRALCSRCLDRDAAVSCTVGLVNTPGYSYVEPGKPAGSEP